MTDKDKRDYLIYLHGKVYVNEGIRNVLYDNSYKTFDQDKWDEFYKKVISVYGDSYIMTIKEFIRERVLNTILE